MKELRDETLKNKQLERQLLDICDLLRYRIEPDQYNIYILGLLFYKYISEKIEILADEILAPERVKYMGLIAYDAQTEAKFLKIVEPKILYFVGVFLRPDELFSFTVGAYDNLPEGDIYTLLPIKKAFDKINKMPVGTCGYEDAPELLQDLNFNNFGNTEIEKNALLKKILKKINDINFHLGDSDNDILGYSYEFLIGEFSKGSARKAGEFYTPPAVASILAKIVTNKKKEIECVYDPTCGSGGLLLAVLKETESVDEFLGQELNPKTYNLARMSMMLNGVNYKEFDIRQGDTLKAPKHIGIVADAIVANPPFSLKWDPLKFLEIDERFAPYKVLAPKKNADMAFLQHITHHLCDYGTAAAIFPHGVLFREGAESKIRQQLIGNFNYIQAIIGLPKNIFLNTSLSVCVLVIKKDRKAGAPVLFVDASKEYEKGGKQNFLLPAHIKKIVSTYSEKTEVKKYSRLVSLDEIKDNDYNLNISRYVDIFEEDEPIDIDAVAGEIVELDEKMKETDTKIFAFCEELGIKTPFKL